MQCSEKGAGQELLLCSPGSNPRSWAGAGAGPALGFKCWQLVGNWETARKENVYHAFLGGSPLVFA